MTNLSPNDVGVSLENFAWTRIRDNEIVDNDADGTVCPDELDFLMTKEGGELDWTE